MESISKVVEFDAFSNLLKHPEPAIRYLSRFRLLDESPDSPKMQDLSAQVRASEKIQKLLSYQDNHGFIPGNPYQKYTGAHWVLAALADTGYPPGDPKLIPLRDQVYEKWLDPDHTAERIVSQESRRYKSRPGVPIIQGRARRCASQEGNALWSTLKLGIADDRAEQLARNLMRWQWPDGGWNCDRKTDAVHSSYHESLLPLRALALYAKISSDKIAQRSADQAAEIFLKRHLYLRRQDGQPIHESFTRIYYPSYGHYDFLMGLKVMTEIGQISDPRCTEALDLLESHQLPDGRFPCHRKFYKVVQTPVHGGSLVDWGGSSRTRSNPWVSLDAFYVLKKAGRLSLQANDLRDRPVGTNFHPDP